MPWFGTRYTTSFFPVLEIKLLPHFAEKGFEAQSMSQKTFSNVNNTKKLSN